MPGTTLRIVLDTDAFNEIDDQFAIAYLRRLAPDLSTEAIYAAPFSTSGRGAPRTGCAKSYAEIIVVLDALGGHALHWHRNDEFDLRQDVAVSRTILDAPVPLLLLPCMGVVSLLTTTLAELERCLDTAVPINGLLVDRFGEAVDGNPSFARALWDVAAVAALRNPAWVPADRTATPVVAGDLRWARPATRHEISIARHVDRNPIIANMFDAVNRQPRRPGTR